MKILLFKEEDAEFKKEQDRRKKEKREMMIKRNKQRRMEREKEERRLLDEKHALEDEQLRRVLETMFGCQGCDTVMSPPAPIYQCKDGHIICGDCKQSEKFKVKLIRM